MRGTNRAARLGCVDRKEMKKNNRKRDRAQQKERNTKLDDQSLVNFNIDWSSSSEEEVDEDDEEVIFDLEKKRHQN